MIYKNISKSHMQVIEGQHSSGLEEIAAESLKSQGRCEQETDSQKLSSLHASEVQVIHAYVQGHKKISKLEEKNLNTKFEVLKDIVEKKGYHLDLGIGE